jgi:hypothetical protein
LIVDSPIIRPPIAPRGALPDGRIDELMANVGTDGVELLGEGISRPLAQQSGHRMMGRR